MTTIRQAWPQWAVDAAEVARRWEDPDAFRHDIPEPAPLWPEVVDDRCRICGQVVESGLIECNECFLEEDTSARRREDY